MKFCFPFFQAPTVLFAVLMLFPLRLCVGGELTPAAAESQALGHNPDLAAARFRIEEAKGRMTGAGRRPNPEIQVESNFNTNVREGGLMVGWVQKFPKASKLRMEKEVTQLLLEAAEAEVQVAERQLMLTVRGLVVKALALSAHQELRTKQLANARELATFTNKRVESGEVSGVDAVQFELEAQQIEVEAQLLASEMTGVMGELKPLLGMKSADALSIKGSLPAISIPGAGGSVSNRPELLVAERNEQAAQKNIELEKARRRDDISAGFFAGFERTEDAPEGLSNDGVIGFRVSIPLPFWNKNEGKIKEATAAASRLAAEKQAMTHRLEAEAGSARERMKSLAALVEKIDGTMLPKASELEAKVKGFYQTGQTPLTDVLRAREKRFQLEKSRLDALREFHLIRASLGIGLHTGTKP